jgi:hypothetical protein
MISTTMSATVVPAALMLTFIANDVWNEDSRAKAVVVREGIAISESFKLMRHLPAQIRSPLQQALQAYAASVATSDWEAMQRRSASEKTDEAMHMLRSRLYEAKQASPSFDPVLDALAEQLKIMVEAKETRRSIAQLEVSPVKWKILILLFFINACAMCELNTDNRREKITGLILLSFAFSSICWLILIYDRPFIGTTIIEPDLIRQALADNPPQ